MLEIDFSVECYSCGACIAVCPKSAILFGIDKKGFLKPEVDLDVCVNCGLCENVCISKVQKNNEPLQAISSFYGFNKNSVVRENSSSGGFFFAIAKQFIEEGGLVCGCVWNDNVMPEHILTDSEQDLTKMMGSKYVQSDISKVYKPIQEALAMRKKVVFFGVPCQIYALKKYFNDNSNLTLIAIVCHGVMSRSVWETYLNDIHPHERVVSCTMRNKDKGWKNYGLVVQFKDGYCHRTYRNTDGLLLRCYTDGLFERERCLSCQFKESMIKADIVLGDGWGTNSIVQKMDDGKGISGVIVCTKKGEKLWKLIENQFVINEVPLDLIIESNQRIVKPAEKNKGTDRFYRQFYNGKSLNKLLKVNAKANVIRGKIDSLLKRFCDVLGRNGRA